VSKPATRRRFLKYGLRGLIAAGLTKGFYNTTSRRIELVKIRIKLPGLPPSFRGLKIALLSDFHASLIANEDLFARASVLAMEQKPDLIVLTGDFVTGSTKFLSSSIGEFNREYMDGCLNAIAGIRAPMGIYAVLGNHDFWSGHAAVKTITQEYTRRLGVVWLRNESVTLRRGGGTVDLLGVDDYWEESCSLSSAYRGLKNDTVKVLLSHNPDIHTDIFPQMRVDLILSGHTHGGQIVAPIIGMPFIPSKFGQKYRAGLVKDGARQTYITRGIGYLLAPIRFNCPPEVTLITLT
jgi:hypothetical protein